MNNRPRRPRIETTPGKKKRQEHEERSNEVRLNKFLADSGITSRRGADELIGQGVVKVNGQTVSELGVKVKRTDFVTVEGKPVSNDKHLTYVILNKPKDCITTLKDEFDRPTIFDIVKIKQRLFPVGRLDRNTTGALLLTNDGELAHRLMHPSFQIPRVYNVGLDRKLEFKDAAQIARGVELEDGPTAPCQVFIDPEDNTRATLEITEGRNREVRRIFESLDYHVRKLDRKSYGPISTRGLSRGQYRHLTRDEIRDLRRAVGF
ncbi:MAG TPA: pseudouridine synthase [Patescibacteria group bacterium]|nr:pseudouridine synthase [Patescibacteria group bacterium]